MNQWQHTVKHAERATQHCITQSYLPRRRRQATCDFPRNTGWDAAAQISRQTCGLPQSSGHTPADNDLASRAQLSSHVTNDSSTYNLPHYIRRSPLTTGTDSLNIGHYTRRLRAPSVKNSIAILYAFHQLATISTQNKVVRHWCHSDCSFLKESSGRQR